ncbi:MAG TPA: class I SAM-dependent methyltransferase [Clostridiales bacterium]|nr:class I SAM-dependent methyltransferase [Clostridiales bacterium]HOL92186.1 class I SAM-dependent methyltransferase [Clostridiales bacterium]HPP36228.1 class I SAM-dependent methyltransferase [Clostridiales bacterium]
MYLELCALLKKPDLYERTHEKFWNDPHISKGMLEAHLDPNTDAASRRPEFIDRSVEWIISLLPEGASLLDIGCGPGLYTKRFADRGFSVTGMDLSEHSISYAREHDKKSNYVFMDYLQMDYENAFDMITLIYCDYGALIPVERAGLLQRVYRALKPGGRFLFDVFTPVYTSGIQEGTSWEICRQGGFWSDEPYICLNAQYRYNENISLDRYVIIKENAVHCYNIWDTSFTTDFLLSEVLPAGFIYDGFYADVAGNPYYEGSETLCAVFRK